jgi:hypothetical protein
MEPAVLTASAAVLGSLTGASASIATAWLSQRTQGRRAAIQAEVHRREVLYADFIIERLREMSFAELHDPLRPFSEACRQELRLLEVRV